MKLMKLFVVGKCKWDGGWEFQGVFDSEELALAACRAASYFIAPATLNESLPDETEAWPGSYYPLSK
jgi:hypothetical protein